MRAVEWIGTELRKRGGCRKYWLVPHSVRGAASSVVSGPEFFSTKVSAEMGRVEVVTFPSSGDPANPELLKVGRFLPMMLVFLIRSH